MHPNTSTEASHQFYSSSSETGETSTNMHEGTFNISNVEKSLEVFTLLVICVIGTVMNSLIIWVVTAKGRTCSATLILISNLAFIDLVISALVCPLAVYGIINEDWDLGSPACVAAHAILSLPYCVSIWGHFALAYYRYCRLRIHSKWHQRFTTKTAVIANIAIIWAYHLMLHLVLIWLPGAPTTVTFLRHYALCGIVTDPNYDESMAGLIVVHTTFPVSLIVPFLASIVTYIAIARLVRTQICTFPTARYRRDYLEMKRSTFAPFVVFCVCWLPDYLRLALDYNNQSPVWIVRLLNNLVFLDSAVNPLIFAFRFETIRGDIVKLFCRAGVTAHAPTLRMIQGRQVPVVREQI